MKRHYAAQADFEDDGWMFLDSDEMEDVTRQAADDVVLVISAVAALVGAAVVAVFIKRRSRRR